MLPIHIYYVDYLCVIDCNGFYTISYLIFPLRVRGTESQFAETPSFLLKPRINPLLLIDPLKRIVTLTNNKRTNHLQRALKELLEAGFIEKVGKGRAMGYTRK